MSANLERLLQHHPELRRGPGMAAAPEKGIPTGFPVLDRQLPGGGWPGRAITELLVGGGGAHALGLLLPALARLSREGRWIVLVAPPWLPYAPALQAAGVDLARLLLVEPAAEPDRLWALEQALRSGGCSAVLAWPRRLRPSALRRLQLAAEAGAAGGFLFRPFAAAAEHSPAALRLRLAPAGDGWEIDLLKRRGGWPLSGIRLPLRPAE
ncbi:MAG TPA: translesion DNA synthesis-associated protein ImuA [Sedimenticola thiotaurini]|uniref:Translesion DNA synthesis-associated protein ImuA n=1 Tax=Sedimenticola thiotaurini TaxID=1543721 RepID=A0A831W4K8_9GAMM|nr:translesion DNA synthesis-associated protein ImuA [Sedimenticola thiotaurini]